MTEPMELSRWRAHERRSEFDAKARALALAAGLPTRPYKKTGFPLPAWARFYADDRALVVLVCTGEQWRTIEKALAYGVAHAQGRKLELIMPEHWQGKGDPVQATLVRAAFLRTDIKIWTHDGNTARPCGLVDPREACRLLQEGALRGGELDLQGLAWQVTDLENWATASLTSPPVTRNPTGPGAARHDPSEHPASQQGPAGEIRRPLLETDPR